MIYHCFDFRVWYSHELKYLATARNTALAWYSSSNIAMIDWELIGHMVQI